MSAKSKQQQSESTSALTQNCSKVRPLVNVKMSDPSLEMEVEGNSYRTWPDRMGVVGGKKETQAGRRPSLSGLLMAKSPKNLEALEVLRRPTLATALSSLSISYSPKTRGLHDSESKDKMVPNESQRVKVPATDTEAKSCDDLGSKPSDSDQNFLRSDNKSTCDDWNPECGSEQLDGLVQAELGLSENAEPNCNQPVEEKEKSVVSKEGELQDDENQGEVFHENQGEVLGQQRYVPTHRKAFSLPRTLEVNRIFLFFLWIFLSLVAFDHQTWAVHLCHPHSQRKHIKILFCSLRLYFVRLRF